MWVEINFWFETLFLNKINDALHFPLNQPKYELEELVKLVDGSLSEDEQLALEELHQYLLLGDGCWALSDLFLVFVGRVLRDPQLSTEARVHLLRALAFAALKDDVILLLHQDRRDHVMMGYLLDIEKIKPEEQQAVALFVSNKYHSFLHVSSQCVYIHKYIDYFSLVYKIINKFFFRISRHVIYSRTQMLQSGCYTSQNGLLVISKFQIFVQQQKLLFTAFYQHVQNFKNWEQLWHTIWALRK